MYTNVHSAGRVCLPVAKFLTNSQESEGNMLSTKGAESEDADDGPANGSNKRSGELIETVTCPNCKTRIPAQVPDTSREQKQTMLPRPVLLVIAVVCGLYLVMPTLGIFELIPDAIPLIGSLDEAGATAGLLFAAGGLGWLDFFRQK